MEIVIVVAIWTVIVKRGVEDVLHAARGNTPHRYTAARKGGSGAWGRYWRALSDDVAADLLDRHNQRRARRASQPPKPTFADRWKYGRMAFRYARWNTHNRLKRAWMRHGAKRREKATRPRPGQDTVPGEVVPNRDETQDEQQDGTEDRPQDEDRPDPTSVPAEDGTDLQDEQDDDDQEDDEMDATERAQWDAYKRFIEKTEPWPIKPATTTQEGPTTMATTAVDGIGLDPQIKFCEESEQQYLANARSNDNDRAISQQFAEAYRRQISVTDAALGGVPQGVAVAAVAAMTAAMDKATAAAADMEQIAALYTQAMDKANSAAADMATAAKEFVSYKNLQEGYAAQPDAPDKEFLLAGR